MLPEIIQSTIDHILEKTSPTLLKKAQMALSKEYREHHSSSSVFSDETTRLCYLASRFPATYAAVSCVLKQIPSDSCQSILDLGAGPATASLAAIHYFPFLQDITLIEKNKEAISLGKKLLQPFEIKSEWIHQDLNTMKAPPKADLAIFSYSIGELPLFDSILKELWHYPIQTFAIIEPGTPKGYQVILKARDLFLQLGASIVAPCPHAKKCPLPSNDWCHFSTRLERTKWHRLIKEGNLSYEDEKFSYLIATKKETDPKGARILRHPQKGSGHIHFSLCTLEGTKEETTITRKTKELYSQAKDASWGDLWPPRCESH